MERRRLRLFNANPVAIGRDVGKFGPGEFPDADALVAHLDYLEVERSLVMHQEARDVNPIEGHLRLLEEIKPHRRRLVPALVVSPFLVFASDGLDFLRDALSAGVRALRAFPRSEGYRPVTLERLLGGIRQFQPTLFISLNEADAPDVVVLAETFPDLKFVVTEFMWNGMGDVLDMLWRRENILVEHSWDHVQGGLETITNAVGPERSLFGFRFKSDYGGSVAALARAQLDDDVKQRVAGGALQDLLSLGPFTGEVRPAEITRRKPLWNAFRQGETLANVEIIDAHGHTRPGSPWSFIGASSQPKRYVRDLIDILDRNGVQRVIVSHAPALRGDALMGNHAIEAACAQFGHGRINGYVVFNPKQKDSLVRELDGFFGRGFFVGFKIHCDSWRVPVSDPCFVTAWEYADRHRLPILLHTWDGQFSSPTMLTDIVPNYPRASFLLGHSGGGTEGRREAVALAAANPNVFLEFCGSFTTNVDFTDAIGKLGIGKIVFGSDLTGHDQAWELGRFLSLPLADEELRPALADNIKRILPVICPSLDSKDGTP